MDVVLGVALPNLPQCKESVPAILPRWFVGEPYLAANERRSFTNSICLLCVLLDSTSQSSRGYEADIVPADKPTDEQGKAKTDEAQYFFHNCGC